MQPLKYESLVVDQSMNKILSEVHGDIDQVRLNPDDYSYKVVTLKEMQDCDGFCSSSSIEPVSINGKKRRFSDDIGEGVKKKRKIVDVVSKAASGVEVIVLD